jgi:hypothetical protein
MKCDDAQRQMLLADSGELSQAQIADLDSHMSSCVKCREFSEDMRRIFSVAKSALPYEGPSAAVMARIRVAAEKRTEAGKLHVFLRPSTLILAHAAAIMLIAGGLLLFAIHRSAQHGNSANTAVAKEADHIGHLNIIVSMVSEGQIEDLETQNGHNAEQQRHMLAQRLLIVEGLLVESVSESEPTGFDEEPLPTDLRSNSSASSDSRICV